MLLLQNKTKAEPGGQLASPTHPPFLPGTWDCLDQNTDVWIATTTKRSSTNTHTTTRGRGEDAHKYTCCWMVASVCSVCGDELLLPSNLHCSDVVLRLTLVLRLVCYFLRVFSPHSGRGWKKPPLLLPSNCKLPTIKPTNSKPSPPRWSIRRCYLVNSILTTTTITIIYFLSFRYYYYIIIVILSSLNLFFFSCSLGGNYYHLLPHSTCYHHLLQQIFRLFIFSPTTSCCVVDFLCLFSMDTRTAASKLPAPVMSVFVLMWSCERRRLPRAATSTPVERDNVSAMAQHFVCLVYLCMYLFVCVCFDLFTSLNVQKLCFTFVCLLFLLHYLTHSCDDTTAHARPVCARV